MLDVLVAVLIWTLICPAWLVVPVLIYGFWRRNDVVARPPIEGFSSEWSDILRRGY